MDESAGALGRIQYSGVGREYGRFGSRRFSKPALSRIIAILTGQLKTKRRQTMAKHASISPEEPRIASRSGNSSRPYAHCADRRDAKVKWHSLLQTPISWCTWSTKIRRPHRNCTRARLSLRLADLNQYAATCTSLDRRRSCPLPATEAPEKPIACPINLTIAAKPTPDDCRSPLHRHLREMDGTWRLRNVALLDWLEQRELS